MAPVNLTPCSSVASYPCSPAPESTTGAWRPWVFTCLSVLTVALAAVWIFKIWRERRAVKQATSYVSMTAVSSQDKFSQDRSGHDKKDAEPHQQGPVLPPVVTMSTSSNPSITTVCHSPKRILSVPQV